MDTLRSSFRLLGAAFMNSELVYSFLMGMGWFFLAGWAVALLVTCASVFRQDRRCSSSGLRTRFREASWVLNQARAGEGAGL